MKKAIYIFIAFVVVVCVLILSTAVDTSKENSVEISGIVKSISEGGVKDVVFELENHKRVYYINRGFENGFEINKAKKDFEGKKITLFYAKSWSLFPISEASSKHITRVSLNDSVVFSEW